MTDNNKLIDRNFSAIVQLCNDQGMEIVAHGKRISTLENNLAMLIEEVRNYKQMSAHINGRGMGSTVHGVN